jgi:hypothetical protein
LAIIVQIVDFREVTFYTSNGCFQISFEKMAKRTSGENPHDLHNIIVKKKMIFEYTTS